MVYLHNTDGLDVRNVTELYHSVSWGKGLTPEEILAAVRASSHLVTAWDDGKLVGLARSMDDGIWSANIDCIIVHADHQRRGIASAMLNELLNLLENVRYISVAPNDRHVAPMYIEAGFNEIPGSVLLQLSNVHGGDDADAE